MGKTARVVIALSGGVDSATAAALLVEQGYEVIGMMLRLWAEADSEGERRNRCCSPEAADGARRVCERLGIPFYLIDAQAPFKERVVDYFIAEYARGRTPNPCLMCNRYIKFGLLLEKALALEADFLATGHYARIRCTDGRYQLLRGVDPHKDQSYFLYMLGQGHLARLLFPVGEYTKEQVREMARQHGLPMAGRTESQDLCFMVDNDYRRFLRIHAPHILRPGPILDRRGQVLGEHQGLPLYTIGQRSGLGIAWKEPLYVLELDPARNAVIVGPARELGRQELIATDVNFVSGEWPEEPQVVTARIRYRGREVPAVVEPLNTARVRVRFREPLRDITPGQGVVFYRGEVVLGGGIIEVRGGS